MNTPECATLLSWRLSIPTQHLSLQTAQIETNAVDREAFAGGRRTRRLRNVVYNVKEKGQKTEQNHPVRKF
jgi:hypothetical protein